MNNTARITPETGCVCETTRRTYMWLMQASSYTQPITYSSISSKLKNKSRTLQSTVMRKTWWIDCGCDRAIETYFPPVPCAAGQYQAERICYDCPKGTYSTEGIASSCISCSDGKTTQGPGEGMQESDCHWSKQQSKNVQLCWIIE